MVLLALIIGGFILYAAHPHDEFFDDDLARSANEACAEVLIQLDDLPSATATSSDEERARAVEDLSRVFGELRARLRPLSLAGDNEGFDRWIERWDEFIEAGRGYAEAIRTGDPSAIRTAGDRGDAPNVALNTIARANGMQDCIL